MSERKNSMPHSSLESLRFARSRKKSVPHARLRKKSAAANFGGEVASNAGGAVEELGGTDRQNHDAINAMPTVSGDDSASDGGGAGAAGEYSVYWHDNTDDDDQGVWQGEGDAGQGGSNRDGEDAARAQAASTRQAVHRGDTTGDWDGLYDGVGGGTGIDSDTGGQSRFSTPPEARAAPSIGNGYGDIRHGGDGGVGAHDDDPMGILALQREGVFVKNLDQLNPMHKHATEVKAGAGRSFLDFLGLRRTF